MFRNQFERIQPWITITFRAGNGFLFSRAALLGFDTNCPRRFRRRSLKIQIHSSHEDFDNLGCGIGDHGLLVRPIRSSGTRAVPRRRLVDARSPFVSIRRGACLVLVKKGDDCTVLTVAQGSGNWQRVRAAAHGATPLSQLIRESRSPLLASLPSL